MSREVLESTGSKTRAPPDLAYGENYFLLFLLASFYNRISLEWLSNEYFQDKIKVSNLKCEQCLNALPKDKIHLFIQTFLQRTLANTLLVSSKINFSLFVQVRPSTAGRF